MTGRPEAKTSVEAYKDDARRLRDLAAWLTEISIGRVGQADALKWVLDWRERAIAELDASEETAQ